MIEIKYNQKNLKNNYTSLKRDFIFDSIFQGLTPAKVYVNNNNDNCLSIVQEGVAYYFGGFSKNESEYQAVIDFYINTLVEKRTHKYHIAKIFFSSLKWKNLLLSKLSSYNIKLVNYNLYQHSLENIPKQQACNYNIVAIDKQLLQKELKHKAGLVAELNYMWGSVAGFLNNGFGSCTVDNQTITGWCTAEYVSDKNCGIGIETVEQYQKQGIAYNNACNLLKMCKEKKLTAHWDCWDSNMGSVKTAEKCGFNKILSYKIIFLKY
ncbi:GNAT family N-acetyltransferase [Clostridium sp. 'deep sea']|uniref:GNAT family N-acetyltransferase n=1 Tax=Clostridium sp. 'deep sea' TaxID=2779445 RepID=UPI0018964B6C|nr:GNAT family N-acetyltransferase [Clostridium sp. 'deep sea']QOR34378.1 GNAT family N-acetyltransferase [Clostridium sp. 'deep sea']